MVYQLTRWKNELKYDRLNAIPPLLKSSEPINPSSRVVKPRGSIGRRIHGKTTPTWTWLLLPGQKVMPQVTSRSTSFGCSMLFTEGA